MNSRNNQLAASWLDVQYLTCLILVKQKVESTLVVYFICSGFIFHSSQYPIPNGVTRSYSGLQICSTHESLIFATGIFRRHSGLCSARILA